MHPAEPLWIQFFKAFGEIARKSKKNRSISIFYVILEIAYKVKWALLIQFSSTFGEIAHELKKNRSISFFSL